LPYLEQFTEDQVEALASLPYRAGLLIGEGDTTGGQDASDAEMRALESIVTGYVEDFCKSEFVEELMRAMLARREKWDSWRGNIENVPAEARAAIDLIATRIDKKQVTALKQNLIEIAFAVAMAYCEYDPHGPLLKKIKAHLEYHFNAVKARRKNQKVLPIQDALSISRAEQKLIIALEEALRPEVVEGVEPAELIEDAAPIPKFEPPPPEVTAANAADIEVFRQQQLQKQQEMEQPPENGDALEAALADEELAEEGELVAEEEPPPPAGDN
jgi:hypothetical protein